MDIEKQKWWRHAINAHGEPVIVSDEGSLVATVHGECVREAEELNRIADHIVNTHNLKIGNPRREFNDVGHPNLPKNPTLKEVSQWLRDMALWEQLQPYGRDMDAREWAATCLVDAADELKALP